MAITANNSDGRLDVGVSDTLLFTGGDNRRNITWASLHNKASAERVVKVYISTDTTSANGEEVDEIALAAGETLPIEFIIGQSYQTGQFIIGVAQSGSAGDVQFQATYTAYTGDD